MFVALALGTPGGLSPADFDADGDGDVDLVDFAAFCRIFNEPTGVRYVWDAENRLIEVEPGMPATGSRDPKTVFTYDHMGRRVRKQTYAWNTGTGVWNTAAATDTKYLYDGWRVIMELDGTNDEIARKYTWGLDLSGSLEGAGGIGGLLATYDTDGTSTTTDDRTFLYTYDGNGNVGQLVETTAGEAEYGTVQAHYEYHLYGKRLNQPAQGEYDQPYRFSTKPFDEETGLGYWGYRYYHPDLGRWMSRDPVNELGAVLGRSMVMSSQLGLPVYTYDINVYGYVGNHPTKKLDPFGLASCDTEGDKCYNYELAGMPGHHASPSGKVAYALIFGAAEAYTCVNAMKPISRKAPIPAGLISGPNPDIGLTTKAFGELLVAQWNGYTRSVWYRTRCSECECGFLCGFGVGGPVWKPKKWSRWKKCEVPIPNRPEIGEYKGQMVPGMGGEEGWRQLVSACQQDAGSKAKEKCGRKSNKCPS